MWGKVTRVAIILAMGVSVATARAETHTQVVPFAAGGSLRFSLRGGDIHIRRGSDEQHIIVRYRPDPDRPKEEQKVQFRSRVHDSQVQIEIKSPRNLSVDTEIEVPSPASIEVHLTGGDLTVEGVEGDKNLHLFAGDIRVDLGPELNLGKAEASTHAGDVNVPAIGKTHGWIGHTWKYQGSGKYSLYAHTGFGDVDVSSK